MKTPLIGALALIFHITTATADSTQKEDSKFEKVQVYGERLDPLKLTNPSAHFFKKEDLEQQQILHTEQVLNLIPNLNISSGSNRNRYIQIRGIGERSEYDSVPTYSVGFYYDHIDLSGAGGIATSFDTDEIQVLKGPQSYLYGDSSIGGNILIQSSDPSKDATHFSLGAGSQNHHRIGLQHNKEVSDSFSFKIGAQTHKSDGFYKNTFLNKPTSNQDELFLNAGLNLNIKNFDIRSRHIFADFKNGYDVWNAYAQDFTTFTDKPGLDLQKTQGHSLEISKSLSPSSNLSLIGSIASTDSFYSYDEDWGNNTFWNQVPGHNADYDYNKSYERKKQNLHTKLIFQKSFVPLIWTSGLHFYQRKDASEILSYKNSSLRSSLNTDYKSDHYALFTSAQSQVTNRLKVTSSLRLEKQRLFYTDDSPFIDDLSSNLFGFEFNTEYKVTKKNQLNLKVSKGFKGAGLNPDISLTPEQKKYSPESLVNYEASWSQISKYFDSKLSLFYMYRDKQQISASAQNDPLDPSDFTIYTDNASKSDNSGIEFTGLLLPSSNLNLELSLGLLRARFINYSREGVLYDGRDVAHAPRQTYSFRFNYKPASKINLSLGGYGKSSFYFSNSHDQKSPGYFNLNTAMSYDLNKNISLNLWARNILDKGYSTRGFYFPNRPPDWESELYTQQGPPLEWGASIAVNL